MSATPTSVAPAAPVLGRVTGQRVAVSLLAASLAAPVHAYLFVGPAGTGKREAALAFGAGLVCPQGGCGRCTACQEALAGRHPDVVVVERHSQSIRVEEARAVGAMAQRAPRVASRQVLILVDFHLVDEAAPALLKTIEEPPGSTVFVVLAERVTPALVTIASRCVEVRFRPIDEAALSERLVADGVDPAAAALAAAAAGGRLDRARLLAAGADALRRRRLWQSLPERLDGSGSTVMLLVAELLASCEELVEVAKARHAEESAAAAAAAKAAGERSTRNASLEERHRREQRRARADELRAGLGWLALSCRDRALASSAHPRREQALLDAAAAIDAAAAMLVRNPNEALLLQSLLLRLDAVPG